MGCRSIAAIDPYKCRRLQPVLVASTLPPAKGALNRLSGGPEEAIVVMVPLTTLSRVELAELKRAPLEVMGSSSWLIRVQPKLLH